MAATCACSRVLAASFSVDEPQVAARRSSIAAVSRPVRSSTHLRLSTFRHHVRQAPASRRSTGLPIRAMSEHAERHSRQAVLEPFTELKALKIIAGLKNLDKEKVAAVVAAAENGRATHVDIACDPALVRMAMTMTSLPVCVSAVNPELFMPAVEAGASMVEVGNYDPFYPEGRTFDAEEVLSIACKTRALLPNIPLSVTVPHTLPLPEQVLLAEALEAAGVDIIQTEGGTSSAPVHAGVQGLIEKAAPTLAATYAICQAVNIPVMCSSGISDVTAPMAMAVGASGVGVGSAVNKLNSRLAMVAAVRSIVDAMERYQAVPLKLRNSC